MSAEFRAEFEEKLLKLISRKDTSSFFLTKEKYLWVIDRIDRLTTTRMRKTPADYRFLKLYEIVIVPGTGEKKLRKPFTRLLYVSNEDLFDVIYAAHVATGHGAHDVMNVLVKEKYANVMEEVLQLFADVCDECQAVMEQKMPLMEPVSSSAMPSVHQVDVVDLQMNPHEYYHYLMANIPNDWRLHFTKGVSNEMNVKERSRDSLM